MYSHKLMYRPFDVFTMLVVPKLLTLEDNTNRWADNSRDRMAEDNNVEEQNVHTVSDLCTGHHPELAQECFDTPH